MFTFKGKVIATVTTSFERARDVAGLPDVRFHDLRHTFASRLVQQGVPLYEVMQLTGHKSLVMVQRYAHFAPEFQERAIGVHNNYWYDSGTVGDLPQKQEMLDTKISTISVGLKLVEPWGIEPQTSTMPL